MRASVGVLTFEAKRQLYLKAFQRAHYGRRRLWIVCQQLRPKIAFVPFVLPLLVAAVGGDGRPQLHQKGHRLAYLQKRCPMSSMKFLEIFKPTFEETQQLRSLDSPSHSPWQDFESLPSTKISLINELLPDEILHEIFLEALPYPSPFEYSLIFGRRSYFFGHSLNTERAPWTFTHVCRRWRAAATNFPPLWMDVGVVLPFLHSGETATFWFQMKYLLGLQLQYSGNRPLWVSLTVPQALRDTSLDHRRTRRLMKLLFSSSPRWQAFSYPMNYETWRIIMSTYGPFVTLPTPLLHTLSFGNMGDRCGSSKLFFPPFQPMSSLKSIIGCYHILQRDSGDWDMILPQITKFRTVNYPRHSGDVDPLITLKKLPNLEDCRLHCPTVARPTKINHLVFLRLHTLSLRPIPSTNVNGRIVPCSLLKYLVLPSLRSLTIGGKVSSRIVVDLRDRSGSQFNLTSITVDGDSNRNLESCIELFKHFPSITLVKFTLSRTPVILWFFEKLAASRMLPSLALVQLDCLPYESFRCEPGVGYTPRRFRIEYIPRYREV